MEKETFEFYVDEEITTWYRHSFSVNATSLEEATALVTEAFKRGGFDEIPMLDEYNDDSESEILYEATESTGKEQLYTWPDDALLAELD